MQRLSTFTSFRPTDRRGPCLQDPLFLPSVTGVYGPEHLQLLLDMTQWDCWTPEQQFDLRWLVRIMRTELRPHHERNGRTI